MTAQSQVPKLYQTVIEDVINSVREAFMDEGVDESVLSELKNIWQNKLTASKVLENDAPPPANDPMIAGPYMALQQEHNNGNPIRHPGYQSQQHSNVRQSEPRPSAAPTNSAPMFTTLTHPGADLSDAASMAYSSLLQSQQRHGSTPAAAGSAVGSRAQLAAQPQYLYTTPGGVGSVMIPQSQAIRLQQQQQQQQQQLQNRGSGARGSLPQVDGALDERSHASPSIASLPVETCPSSPFSPSVKPNAREKDPLFASPCSSNNEEMESPASDPNFDLSSLKDSMNFPRNIRDSDSLSQALSPELSSTNAHSSRRSADAAKRKTAADGHVVSSSSSPCKSQLCSPSSAKLCAPSGDSLRGKILESKRLAKDCGKSGFRPRKGDKIEFIFQVDGNHSSSDDDDDDDDDGDINEDDSSDRDPDDEDIPGVEDEPLNSEDDVSDNDPEELFDTENVVVCQYEKISRVRNKWRFYLKDGIMNIQGRDYVFLKASGEAEW